MKRMTFKKYFAINITHDINTVGATDIRFEWNHRSVGIVGRQTDTHLVHILSYFYRRLSQGLIQLKF